MLVLPCNALWRFPCWLLIYKYWRNSLGFATPAALRLANLAKCFWDVWSDKTDGGSGSNSDNDGVWVFTLGATWFSKAVRLEVVSGRKAGEHPGYYLLVRYWSLTPPNQENSPRDISTSAPSLFIDVIHSGINELLVSLAVEFTF